MVQENLRRLHENADTQAASSVLRYIWNTVCISVVYIHIGGLFVLRSGSNIPLTPPTQDVGDQKVISLFKQQHSMGH